MCKTEGPFQLNKPAKPTTPGVEQKSLEKRKHPKEKLEEYANHNDRCN